MLERWFSIRERGSTPGREVLGGLTTFLTMAYILVVHPGILAGAGIDRQASVTVTALVATFGTLAMGLYARRPFAIAPYMGVNAFVAYVVAGSLGHSWQEALGAVFLGGVAFTLITLLGLRARLARAVPMSLKCAFVVGIGLFLAFIGLEESGIVSKPAPAMAPPVELGDFRETSVQLALGGLGLMVVLHVLHVRSGMLVGIAVVTALAVATGAQSLPNEWFSAPSLAPVALQLDIGAALRPGFFPVLLTLFVLDFVDTMGTLIGVSARGGLLDREGNLPEIEKPMLVDSLSTVGGSLLGTTTCGTFIESAAGIEAGARTGLASVVTGLCFLPAIFFSGLLGSVPPCAYGPALVLVGVLMFEPIRRIDFDDATEVIPAFLTVILMIFTYNIGNGITAGLVTYPALKLLSGRWREVSPGLWVLGGLSTAYFVLGAIVGAH